MGWISAHNIYFLFMMTLPTIDTDESPAVLVRGLGDGSDAAGHARVFCRSPFDISHHRCDGSHVWMRIAPDTGEAVCHVTGPRGTVKWACTHDASNADLATVVGYMTRDCRMLSWGGAVETPSGVAQECWQAACEDQDVPLYRACLALLGVAMRAGRLFSNKS